MMVKIVGWIAVSAFEEETTGLICKLQPFADHDLPRRNFAGPHS